MWTITANPAAGGIGAISKSRITRPQAVAEALQLAGQGFVNIVVRGPGGEEFTLDQIGAPIGDASRDA